MLILPEWTTFNIAFYAYIALMVAGIFPAEYFGWYEMQYSKFRAKQGIPSRLGMVILYGLPLVALMMAAWPYLSAPTLVQALVSGAVAVHFAKRVLEGLFLHKYSGTVTVATTALIATLYTLTAFIIGWLNRTPLPAPDAGVWLGLALFAAGIAGNFYHHLLLAHLRKPGESGYVIPRGGLFGLVVCPHYLFELIGWLGIVLMSRHLATLLLFLFMLMYLSARSLKTLRWYHERFPDFPKERKALIPFVL